MFQDTVTSTPDTAPSPTQQRSTIVNFNVTFLDFSLPGMFIGDSLGGPVVGSISMGIGSMCGIGVGGAYIPATGSLYLGPTIACGLQVGSGRGAGVSVISAPPGRDPKQAASGASAAITFQPRPAAGSTVVKSPSNGEPLLGPSFGGRFPVGVGGGYNFCVSQCRP